MTRPEYPFTTDGCSGLFMRVVHAYWRRTGQHEKSRKVRALCEAHDATYWPGGTAVARVKADAVLMVGVAELGNPFLARWMVVGVGVGGPPWWPFGWRWAYGRRWRWRCGYREEDAASE